MNTILVVVQTILAIVILVSIMMQPSKADALSGLIQGATKDTFFSKNKARTKEVVLVRLTVLFSILFAVNTVVVNLIK